MINQNILPAGPNESKIRQMIKFMREPISFFEKCRKDYGKIFTIRLPSQPPYVVITDPNDIKQLLTASPEELFAGEINGSVFKPVLGEFSLLTLDGQKHLQHRKLMLPPLHGERMQVYAQIMSELTRKAISRWQEATKMPIFNEMRAITYGIILRTVFGIDEDNLRFNKLEKLLKDLLFTIKSPYGLVTLLTSVLHVNLGPFTPWAKIQKLRKEIDSVLYEEIKLRKSTDLSNRIDILSLLLQARDESGQPMSNQEIRDEMITLLIAGHETSATSMSWVLYRILSNVKVLTKIKNEIATVTSQQSNIVNSLSQLTYLDATIKETLRMLPVIPYIARLTKNEYKINNFILPKDVAIVPCIYLTHHEPEIWSEPKNFSPERFINSSEKPYTYLPFGGGMRRCIGAAFAHYEIKIVLAEILQHTDLELTEGYIPKPIRKGIVISPADGLPISVKKKREVN